MPVKCQSNVGIGKVRLGKDSIGKDKESTRFTPPTLTEVKQYCYERNSTINPEQFIDFYESKGWMVGKNKMKDWKSAIRNWERRDTGQGQTQVNTCELPWAQEEREDLLKGFAASVGIRPDAPFK